MPGRTDTLDFFDTKVLVAATIEGHVHHSACNKRLVGLGRRAACSAHTLAETYTTLTRKYPGYSLPPLFSAQVCQNASSQFTIITLTAKETLEALQAAARLNLAGAIIYDALLIAAARKAQARFIYTNNASHFRHVAPDLAARIREP